MLAKVGRIGGISSGTEVDRTWKLMARTELEIETAVEAGLLISGLPLKRAIELVESS